MPNALALVACIDGQVFFVPLDKSAPTRLTDADHRQSAFSISPKGSYPSYVRDGELYFRPLGPERAKENRVSFDANTTLTNGLADFLAVEEMHDSKAIGGRQMNRCYFARSTRHLSK